MDLGLNGRVALVCGSSSGLGLAIATTLAEEGCRVALNGRNETRLEPALKQVRGVATDTAAAFQADVSVPAEVERLVGRVTDDLGPIDILVCNAGGPPPTTFSDAPADSWQEALELNLLSTVNLCRAAVPGMRERKRGRVVCIASVAAKQPLGSLILSTTARAGVLGFMKFLADEVAADGVTVNSVCPGYTRTGRVEELLDELSAQRKLPREEVERDVVRDIPAGRMGKPEELAAVVTFLASDRASYITGVALQVDGGFIRSIV